MKKWLELRRRDVRAREHRVGLAAMVDLVGEQVVPTSLPTRSRCTRAGRSISTSVSSASSFSSALQ